jgi:sialic acid synthase SpsE
MRKVKIGNRLVGPGEPCYIIAEIGLNHNGKLEIAKKLVDEAVKAQVDAVKFQKRTIDKLLIREWLDKPYGGPNSFGATYGEHRQNLELSDQDWHTIAEYCMEKGIDFFASPWDLESADFLATLPMVAMKVASADVTNLPLVEHIAQKNFPVIMSTGMSSLEEIDEAVSIITRYNEDLILLHCISAYPFDNEYANLNIIHTLQNRYSYPIGYSGHEKSGIVISLGAVALGACVIERHFTLDHTMKGPDHAASLEPEGMSRLVESIRKLESALGNGQKEILEIEKSSREKLAKSIVSSREIRKGSRIVVEDLTVKSPGIGLKPRYIPRLIGKTARENIPADAIIPKEALDW